MIFRPERICFSLRKYLKKELLDSKSHSFSSLTDLYTDMYQKDTPGHLWPQEGIIHTHDIRYL